MSIDELKVECVRLAQKHDGLKDGCVCLTSYDDGWWGASVASARHCVGVYGLPSKLAALNALAKALVKP